MPIKIAVFVGHSGTGKSTFAETITDEAHRVASSKILMQDVIGQGLRPTHANIHRIGMTKIAEDPSWQAKQVVALAEGKDFFIFDGPRNPFDIDYLIQLQLEINVVAFLVPMRIRYQRIAAREKEGITPQVFLERCADEVLDARLDECVKRANIFVFNVGSSIGIARDSAITLKTVLIGKTKIRSRKNILFPPSVKGNPLRVFQDLEIALENVKCPIVRYKEIEEFLGHYLQFEKTLLRMFRENRPEVRSFPSLIERR